MGLNGKQSFEFSFHSPLHWFDWVANPSIKLAAFLLFAHPSGRNFRRRQKTPLFQRDIQSLSSSSAASLSFVWAFYNIWLGHAMIVFYGGTWLSVHANLWLTLTKSNSLPSIYNSKYLSCRCSSDHNSRLASIWFFCHLMKYIFTLISIVRRSLPYIQRIAKFSVNIWKAPDVHTILGFLFRCFELSNISEKGLVNLRQPRRIFMKAA